VAGQKKNKIRITILFASSSTALKKLELLFIGISKQPRLFNKVTPEQLGIQYTSNKRAWMSLAYFHFLASAA